MDFRLSFLQNLTSSVSPDGLRRIIWYSSAAYLVSFLLPWFGWVATDDSSLLPGLHLFVSLCLFDSCFRVITHLYHSFMPSVLPSGLSPSTNLSYIQLASVIASSGVFMCELLSVNLDELANFQVTCGCLGILCCGCIAMSGRFLDTNNNMNWDRGTDTRHNQPAVSADSIIKALTQPGFLNLNLIQMSLLYHRAFLMGFTKVIYDYMFAKLVFSSFVLSSYYATTLLLPQVRQFCILISITCQMLLWTICYHVISISDIVANIISLCSFCNASTNVPDSGLLCYHS